jgi:hypothetical protein
MQHEHREYEQGGRLELSITLCPEIAGGGIPLFEDGLAPGSWKLVDSNATQSGALCLLYDRARG